MLRQDRKRFITKDIGRGESNPNKFWKGVASLLNRKKTSSITEILDSQGKIVKGKEAAREINKCFCDIGPNLASKFPEAKLDFATTKVDWGNKIRLKDTMKEIEKLDIKKSSGIPQLSCKILKTCLLLTANRFTNLLNLCVENGVFPRKWKQALVVPIPKGKSSKLVTNIRPISLLPVTGKILEKIMLSRMQEYLLSNNLMCSEHLSYVNSYRYLGVDLDSQLSMGLHLQNIINRVKPLLYQLGKLRYFIDEVTALCIYKSFILPLLEIGNYLLLVISNQIKRQQKVQNQALRTVYRTDQNTHRLNFMYVRTFYR